MQVAVVSTGTMMDTDVVDLLKSKEQDDEPSNFDNEQCKDPKHYMSIIDFLRDSVLPSEEKQAKKLALQGNQFVLVDNIVYYVDTKNNGKRRAVVPKHLQNGILEENHSGRMAGHFAVSHLYAALCRSWW